MSQLGFFFDGTRCTGCKTCLFACKDAHDLSVGVTFRRVYEYTGGSTTRDEDGCFTTTCFSYPVSLSCGHCSRPVCVQVCPTEAMHKSEETGLVSVDAAHCVGCGYCHLACPYNAPKVDRAVGHTVKCDGCAERVAAGEMPVCIEACPCRALAFGPAEDLQKHGERAALAPFPDPSATVPNVFTKPSEDALRAANNDGNVANPLETR